MFHTHIFLSASPRLMTLRTVLLINVPTDQSCMYNAYEKAFYAKQGTASETTKVEPPI